MHEMHKKSTWLDKTGQSEDYIVVQFGDFTLGGG